MTKPIPETAPPPVQRSSEGLRNILFDEIDAMRSGVSNPTRGNAVARLVTGVVEVVNMEIEVAKFAKIAPSIAASPALPVSLQLGSAG